MPADENATFLQQVPCPLCGEGDASLLFSGRDLLHGAAGAFGVSRCRRCGFVFTSPRPRVEDLPRYYPDDYSPHTPKPPRRRGLRDVLRSRVLRTYYGHRPPLGRASQVLLLPALAAFRASSKNLFYVPWSGQGRILDVGCGAGKFLWRLQREGWNVKGLDSSEAAARSAAQAFSVDVAVGTYPHEHFDEESFDAVTLWNSLEHMSDPVAVLESCRRALAGGGRVYASVPNFASFGAGFFRENWFPLDLPRHLNHFAPETMRDAFYRAGLRTISVRPLRRTSALRKSAHYAKAAGDRRFLVKVLATRFGAGAFGRIFGRGRRCDLMVACAEKT